MKKLISFSFLIIFMISQVFCHEQTKQKMTINPDPLTEKWIKCENSSPEEYQKNLEEFLIEVENSKPDKTILYYYLLFDWLVSSFLKIFIQCCFSSQLLHTRKRTTKKKEVKK